MQALNLKNYQVLVGGEEIWTTLNNILYNGKPYTNIIFLVDENTRKHCLPIIRQHLSNENVAVIEIASGEINKSLESCRRVWELMISNKADRHSVLVTIGGGVITDLGGFCAGTYKRGIDFIQVPTTLLGMTDASIGGKTGIDFAEGNAMPVKNVIGVFKDPQAVLVYPRFLHSLPYSELRSGFAETIKHALIADVNLWNRLQTFSDLRTVDWSEWLVPSIKVKQRIVEADPFENGIRKALNFGHTIGHAIESYALMSNKPLLHGEAVAIGMICEAWLSVQSFVLKSSSLKLITDYIMRFYEKYHLSADANEVLIDLMKQDKKNQGGRINFTLLRNPGDAVIDQTCDPELIWRSLDYYRNLPDN
ncbi:MAG: 3-dehydroquinate synthase [Bacteroidota bacterium]